jgi:glucosamine--fructose-6-phosphate aminotransferase (isomerizing)
MWNCWIYTENSINYKRVKRLEYRGYDSAGVMIYDGDIKLCKTKVIVEEKASKEMTTNGTIGLVIRVGTHGS